MELTFGAALRQIREKELGLSQPAFAEILGVHSSYVSSLEIGRKHPLRATVLKIIERTGISPWHGDHLLAVAGYPPLEEESGGAILKTEPELARLLEVLRDPNVDPAFKDNTRDMLRHLVRASRPLTRRRAHTIRVQPR